MRAWDMAVVSHANALSNAARDRELAVPIANYSRGGRPRFVTVDSARTDAGDEEIPPVRERRVPRTDENIVG